ncbi:hypothetical protein [Spirosoma sp. KNUC1025]|uniref:hypothetical protein n=1 Tax=Spirosoma sp. KNUC1025 TaxID=2894082 RepID=UPI00386A55F0|nr:hypothetical protein LN737_25270 [Spirosoma sp. KNUC1025]
MKIDTKYLCKVCGFEQLDPPWGEDGRTPTFEICVCCGTEFGYEDATLQGVLKYREKWLKQGAKWYDESYKPANWSLSDQLNRVL